MSKVLSLEGPHYSTSSAAGQLCAPAPALREQLTIHEVAAPLSTSCGLGRSRSWSLDIHEVAGTELVATATPLHAPAELNREVARG